MSKSFRATKFFSCYPQKIQNQLLILYVCAVTFLLPEKREKWLLSARSHFLSYLCFRLELNLHTSVEGGTSMTGMLDAEVYAIGCSKLRAHFVTYRVKIQLRGGYLSAEFQSVHGRYDTKGSIGTK